MKPIYLIIASIVIGCTSKEENKHHTLAPIAVEYTTVKEYTLNQTITRSGIISQRKQTPLSFKIGGYIKELKVHEGENVKKGQRLARLDLTEIESQVNQAKINVEKTERDLYRVKNLYQDSVTTFQQLQDAQSAYDIATNQLKIAKYAMSNSTIIAPNDGKILKKLAEEDQLIGPGQPVLFYSNDASKTLIKIALSDKEFVQLKIGDNATVKFDFYPQIFAGQIIEKAGTANPKNGLFEIAIEIKKDPKYELITGMMGQVTINLNNTNKFTLVPINALSTANKDIATIYILDKAVNKVKEKQIRIGKIENDMVIVNEGLQVGEEIITNGVLYLYDGASIVVRDSNHLFSAKE